MARTFAVVAVLALGVTMSASAVAKVQDLGIPVKSVNWVRVLVGVDGAGKECLYAIMGQQGDNCFVLQIDPTTGKLRQHIAQVPDSNYPTAVCWSRDGRLYVGAAYAGHLLCFDPKADRLEDLGDINPPGDSFPCRIDEAPDGSLFIGCYGTAGLTRYDPRSRQFTRYGRMDEVDMYCYPLVGPDGIVASLIKMTKPHVVLLDPKSGEKKQVGPVTSAESGKWVNLFRGVDGKLYIQSTEGNFVIEGMEARPVDKLPEGEPTRNLADGSTFAFSDAAEQEYRDLVITDTKGKQRSFRLDYQAAGSDIFLVHRGPDGCIYGSSVLPLHLFRYDPKTGEMADLGRCSPAAGEAYSMGNLAGKLYICSYPAAALSVYDPSQPYHFGTEPADNPRDLGTMDAHISYRPRAMLTGPRGRVWTGSEPNYGIWGGPLAWYDPQTGEKHSFRHVLRDQSVISLAWVESVGLIVGGTSIHAGSGTQPRAKQAALFLWDPVRDERIWYRAPRYGTAWITALVAAEGLVYGIAVGTDGKGESFRDLFAFDPAGRKFQWRVPVPAGSVMDNSLQRGEDGKLYGVTSEVVYRLDPGSRKLEVVTPIPGKLRIAGPLVGKTLYFATGTHLRALQLP